MFVNFSGFQPDTLNGTKGSSNGLILLRYQLHQALLLDLLDLAKFRYLKLKIENNATADPVKFVATSAFNCQCVKELWTLFLIESSTWNSHFGISQCVWATITKIGLQQNNPLADKIEEMDSEKTNYSAGDFGSSKLFLWWIMFNASHIANILSLDLKMMKWPENFSNSLLSPTLTAASDQDERSGESTAKVIMSCLVRFSSVFETNIHIPLKALEFYLKRIDKSSSATLMAERNHLATFAKFPKSLDECLSLTEEVKDDNTFADINSENSFHVFLNQYLHSALTSPHVTGSTSKLDELKNLTRILNRIFLKMPKSKVKCLADWGITNLFSLLQKLTRLTLRTEVDKNPADYKDAQKDILDKIVKFLSQFKLLDFPLNTRASFFRGISTFTVLLQKHDFPEVIESASSLVQCNFEELADSLMSSGSDTQEEGRKRNNETMNTVVPEVITNLRDTLAHLNLKGMKESRKLILSAVKALKLIGYLNGSHHSSCGSRVIYDPGTAKIFQGLNKILFNMRKAFLGHDESGFMPVFSVFMNGVIPLIRSDFATFKILQDDRCAKEIAEFVSGLLLSSPHGLNGMNHKEFLEYFSNSIVVRPAISLYFMLNIVPQINRLKTIDDSTMKKIVIGSWIRCGLYAMTAAYDGVGNDFEFMSLELFSSLPELAELCVTFESQSEEGESQKSDVFIQFYMAMKKQILESGVEKTRSSFLFIFQAFLDKVKVLKFSSMTLQSLNSVITSCSDLLRYCDLILYDPSKGLNVVNGFMNEFFTEKALTKIVGECADENEANIRRNKLLNGCYRRNIPIMLSTLKNLSENYGLDAFLSRSISSLFFEFAALYPTIQQHQFSPSISEHPFIGQAMDSPQICNIFTQVLKNSLTNRMHKSSYSNNQKMSLSLPQTLEYTKALFQEARIGERSAVFDVLIKLIQPICSVRISAGNQDEVVRKSTSAILTLFFKEPLHGEARKYSKTNLDVIVRENIGFKSKELFDLLMKIKSINKGFVSECIGSIEAHVINTCARRGAFGNEGIKRGLSVLKQP